MLNDKARAIYDFIVRFCDEAGYPPTIREIGEEFQIASTNGVRYYLKALENAGYVKARQEGKSRCIVPLLAPSSRSAGGATSRRVGRAAVAMLPAAGIPIVGRVAAGSPIAAIDDVEGHLTLEEMFPARDDLFALRVQGQSMKDRGILHGDLVVVRKQEHARDGDAVVALVGSDATVKTYRRREDAVDLVPANPDFQTLTVGPDDDFRLVGVVVGLVRPMGPTRGV
jgi:repressor LexA